MARSMELAASGRTKKRGVPLMYLKDLFPPDADYDGYVELLEQLSTFVLDCVAFPIKAFDIVQTASYGDGKLHHSAILMLTRHFCEQIDGLAILVAQGSAEPSKPVLRSAFEACLGVCHILEGDSERRGLAYHVAHAHRRIKLYRKLDPDGQEGKAFRERIKDDEIGVDVLRALPSFDLAMMESRLASMLATPPYDAVEAERRKRKKQMKGEPSWYSLFGGPRTISALATSLKKAFWYECLYAQWSDVAHAGSGMENVAKCSNEGADGVNVRPLRHPEGLQNLIQIAAGMCIEISQKLLDRYGNDSQRKDLCEEYVATIQKRMRELSRDELIVMPWK